MKIEKISIDKLLLDPANARKHGKKNLDSIKGSLAKFGQQKPIVVNTDNVIVAGNGTLQAAKELGWKEINIVRTDLKGSDITAFGIADNRTSELAEWDDDVLKELLEGLKAEDFDLSAIGFDDFFEKEKEEKNIPIKDSDASFVKSQVIVSFNEVDRFEIINAITEALLSFEGATVECVGDE